ncbi:hypothetical protein ABZ172_06870 [Streptomyces sp. NPDC006296]|uniref:hypothetical protein n=1 Tax=Streptomyces sp. NPDC006296 TaxID=3156746 RepID=UPI0033AEAE59
MRTTRVTQAAAAPLLVLVLTACGSDPSGSPDTDRPSTPREQPTGDVRAGTGPASELPDGWLESLQEYADCLNRNGAQDVEVDTARGGLALDSVLPPDAVRTCLQYNPVHKNGGPREMKP